MDRPDQRSAREFEPSGGAARPAARVRGGLTIGQKTVTALAEALDMTMLAISKHLKVLEEAYLIERSWRAQDPPCKLRPEPLKVIDEWIAQYRQFFEESFDRMDECLHQLQEEEKDDRQ